MLSHPPPSRRPATVAPRVSFLAIVAGQGDALLRIGMIGVGQAACAVPVPNSLPAPKTLMPVLSTGRVSRPSVRPLGVWSANVFCRRHKAMSSGKALSTVYGEWTMQEKSDSVVRL